MIEGIGLSRSTANFEAGRELIDDAVRVTDAQAMAIARWLMERDGIFIGSSSAVNCTCCNGLSFSNAHGFCKVSLLSKSL
jgi:cysteine synthase A